MRTCEGCDVTLTRTDVWGIEIPGIYDGVLYWTCAYCEYAWPRMFPENFRLSEQSRFAAADRNERARREVERVSRP